METKQKGWNQFNKTIQLEENKNKIKNGTYKEAEKNNQGNTEKHSRNKKNKNGQAPKNQQQRNQRSTENKERNAWQIPYSLQIR